MDQGHLGSNILHVYCNPIKDDFAHLGSIEAYQKATFFVLFYSSHSGDPFSFVCLMFVMPKHSVLRETMMKKISSMIVWSSSLLKRPSG
mmetsp:Transcript_37793/g.60673  ORF Transcript_37793/g.60673 Transcript_37793/m.60673 type:complete len:89 (-) Transcript_37793:46-312(-)